MFKNKKAPEKTPGILYFAYERSGLTFDPQEFIKHIIGCGDHFSCRGVSPLRCNHPR